MEVLWNNGACTVGHVVETLAGMSAYSSVLTTLRILENKGYVRHEKSGRAFVYHPVVRRDDARRSAIRYVMSRFFDDSAESLVLNLIKNKELDTRELDRIKKIVEDTEAQDVGKRSV
jgi:predicted transcriptional regulator